LASSALIPPYWFPRVLPGGPGDAEIAQDLSQVLAGVEHPLSLTEFGSTRTTVRCGSADMSAD